MDFTYNSNTVSVKHFNTKLQYIVSSVAGNVFRTVSPYFGDTKCAIKGHVANIIRVCVG